MNSYNYNDSKRLYDKKIELSENQKSVQESARKMKGKSLVINSDCIPLENK
jgi:hypothetical protein